MNFIIVGIIVSLVFAGITFIATQNVLSSFLILMTTLMFFVLIARRLINKNQLKIHRYHQCFQFINTFIISLNVKGSLSSAIQSAYDVSESGTREIIDSIKASVINDITIVGKGYVTFDALNLMAENNTFNKKITTNT